MTRLGSVLAAAVLAVATTVLPGLSVAPAEAVACSDAGGVTVVVDPGSLPGSLSQTCVGGSGKAAGLFGSAGHTLTRVQRFPGAVCKVDGEPADSSCVNMPPTNAPITVDAITTFARRGDQSRLGAIRAPAIAPPSRPIASALFSTLPKSPSLLAVIAPSAAVVMPSSVRFATNSD